MNENIAIKVTNITKIYHLYDKPQDRLKEALHPLRKSYHHDFYALKDVSFEIKKGETVGIIGKNGAGKSTLLKLITGVLTPTSGTVAVDGKISSLLELGAGFNPEMTGLENIYLNGTLMGFTHEEMDSKINAILEFADIGEFIHQQVKTYSSGMFARLAFSVAINVEPDILIVDEALSVGDARFQAKCIRKMEQIASNGVTIVFVSHDMQSIKKFCKDIIWINNGIVRQKGAPDAILDDYMSFMSYGLETLRMDKTEESEKEKNNISSRLIDVSDCDSFGEKQAKIIGVLFLNDREIPTTTILQGTYVKFICEFDNIIDLHDVGIGVLIKDTLNNEVLTFNSYMYDSPITVINAGTRTKCTIKFKVPKIFPKEYIVTVALSEGTQQNHIQQHWIHEATTVSVVSSDTTDACIISLYPNEVEFSYE